MNLLDSPVEGERWRFEVISSWGLAVEVSLDAYAGAGVESDQDSDDTIRDARRENRIKETKGKRDRENETDGYKDETGRRSVGWREAEEILATSKKQGSPKIGGLVSWVQQGLG